MTFFGLALGHPAPVDCTGVPNCDPYPKRWSDYLLWIEIGVLIIAGVLFYLAEMNGND